MEKSFTGSIATSFVKNQVGKKINGAIDSIKGKCQVIKDSLQPTIDIDRLRRLHYAGDICNLELTEGIEQQLDVPDDLKAAWKEFNTARRAFEEVLIKYDIKL